MDKLSTLISPPAIGLLGDTYAFVEDRNSINREYLSLTEPAYLKLNFMFIIHSISFFCHAIDFKRMA